VPRNFANDTRKLIGLGTVGGGHATAFIGAGKRIASKSAFNMVIFGNATRVLESCAGHRDGQQTVRPGQQQVFSGIESASQTRHFVRCRQSTSIRQNIVPGGRAQAFLNEYFIAYRNKLYIATGRWAKRVDPGRGRRFAPRKEILTARRHIEVLRARYVSLFSLWPTPSAAKISGCELLIYYESSMFCLTSMIRMGHARHRLLLVLALQPALLLSACSNEASGPRFFPLVPGQAWQYRVERTTMDGTAEMRHAVTTLSPPPGDLKISAIRETLGGHRYLYEVDDTGVFRVGEHVPEDAADDAARYRHLILPHVLEPNSTWQTTTRTSLLENGGPPWESLFRIDVAVEMDYVVESLDADVSTPAGRFDHCLVVSGHGKTSAEVGNYIGRTSIEISSREWFAPGVGLVRMERQESTGASVLNAGSLTMVLDSWHE
jgi:hypothetical protein